MCLTRRLLRLAAVIVALSQYVVILKTLENSYSLHVAAKYLARLLVFFGGSKVVWLWCPCLWPKPLLKHLNHWIEIIDLCHRQRLCWIDGGCTSGEDASAEHVRAKQNWRYFRHSRDHRKRTGTFITCSRKDHQQVLIDPQRQLMYANISVHNTWRCYRLCRQSADHRIIQCPGFTASHV